MPQVLHATLARFEQLAAQQTFSSMVSISRDITATRLRPTTRCSTSPTGLLPVLLGHCKHSSTSLALQSLQAVRTICDGRGCLEISPRVEWTTASQ